MQEEYHYPAESALVLNWGSAMVQGNYWCRRAYETDTTPPHEAVLRGLYGVL